MCRSRSSARRSPCCRCVSPPRLARECASAQAAAFGDLARRPCLCWKTAARWRADPGASRSLVPPARLQAECTQRQPGRGGGASEGGRCMARSGGPRTRCSVQRAVAALCWPHTRPSGPAAYQAPRHATRRAMGTRAGQGPLLQPAGRAATQQSVFFAPCPSAVCSPGWRAWVPLRCPAPLAPGQPVRGRCALWAAVIVAFLTPRLPRRPLRARRFHFLRRLLSSASLR